MEPWDRTPKWLRWTQHPSVLAPLALFLLFILMVLLTAPPKGCVTPAHWHASVYDVDGQLETSSRYDPPNPKHSESNTVAIVSATIAIGPFGRPFSMTKQVGCSLRTNTFVPEAFNQSQIEQAAITYFNTSPFMSRVAMLSPGQPLRTVIRWEGVLLSLSSFLALVAFCYGFATREQCAIRLERLKQCRCPICKYSIEGLPTNTCPECGANTSVPAPD